MSELVAAKIIPLQGIIDGVNREFVLPEESGEFVLLIGGVVMMEKEDFEVDQGKVKILCSPDFESQRPHIYLVR